MAGAEASYLRGSKIDPTFVPNFEGLAKVDAARGRADRALKDFLPPAIISKRKHGFGLPFGVWLKNTASLRALAGDTLATLRGRQIIRPDFIDSLLNEHLEVHAGYYGTMVWVLIMLELWYQRHVSARNGV